MAITIPGDKGKPGLPHFQISGEQITGENPATSTTLLTEHIPVWVVKNGNDFVKQDVIVMSQTVDIFISDAIGGGNTIPSYDTSGDFVGGTPFTGRTVGGNFEIYYTLNGKDPIRTKAYLYTGQFTLSDNKSGGDNTVIKARSYLNGLWSDVAKMELRIASNVISTNTDADPSV